MTRSRSVVPTAIREHVFIRENVEKNLLSLERPERRQLWKYMSKISKTSLFYVHKRLDQHLRISTGDGVAIYGTVIRKAFIAIVRIVNRCLTVLSVISSKRIRKTAKKPSCTLVDEWLTTGRTRSHIFAAIDRNKNIVWRHEMRTTMGNARIHLEGEIVVPFI
jgi:hypothetical protein